MLFHVIIFFELTFIFNLTCVFVVSFSFLAWVHIVLVFVPSNSINHSCRGEIGRLWSVIIIIIGIIILIIIRVIILIVITVRFKMIGLIIIFIINEHYITKSKYHITCYFIVSLQHLHTANNALCHGQWCPFAPIKDFAISDIVEVVSTLCITSRAQDNISSSPDRH